MRVLIGYDGSEPAAQAVALVAGVAWPGDSHVEIVTAYQSHIFIDAPGLGVDPATVQAIYDDARAEAERLAASAKQQVSQPGLDATCEVGLGRPASVILEAAERLDPDLLLVGHRGLGPFTSALLGSVSEELVDHAPCPVLVVRGATLARVLMADDGSADAEAATSLLLRWPIFRDSKVRVVRVAEVAADSGATSEQARSAAQILAQESIAAAERQAQATANGLGSAGLAADSEVRQGDAARAIVAAADSWSADLIVIGTRGQTGLERLLHGSVARKVLQHAGCSVLVGRRR